MELQYSLEEISEISNSLLRHYSGYKVWCFYAEMGSGKTTLTKEICKSLGVVDDTSSPTFSIVNEYATKDNSILYHFDFYRLKNLQEAMEIGIEEYFFSGNYCFCEWPEVVESILPDKYLKIHINLVGDNKRSLIAQPT